MVVSFGSRLERSSFFLFLGGPYGGRDMDRGEKN
jgi:hypothetical protein